MKNFDASETNGAPLHCLVCEREIPHHDWFARIKLGNHRAAFCRPGCAERYLDAPEEYGWRLGPASAAPALAAPRFNHQFTPAKADGNGLFEWFARDVFHSLKSDLFPPGPKRRHDQTRSCEFVFVRGLPLLGVQAAVN